MILTLARASVSRVLLVRGEAIGEVIGEVMGEVMEEGDPGLGGAGGWSEATGGTLRPRRARAASLGVSGPTSS